MTEQTAEKTEYAAGGARSSDYVHPDIIAWRKQHQGESYGQPSTGGELIKGRCGSVDIEELINSRAEGSDGPMKTNGRRAQEDVSGEG